MSTKRPSRFSPSLSFKLPPHGEDPIPRETNLLVNKLTLLLSRVSSGIDVTRSELTSIHFKVDEIEEIIEGYEEEDSPRRGYEHVFDTEGPRRLIFGTNETTDRYKDLTPIKSLERRSKTLGMKDSRRRQPLSQRQMSPNKVVLMAEEAAELNLKLRQAFRELQEQGGQFKPVPKASLEPNTTRFQQGAVRAPSKRSSPSTEEASETACSATNPSPGRRQAFDVSRQEEGLSLQEPAIDTDKHNREDPLPGASNQPTKAHQVAHQATDLAFTLESTITELQARREEALHIQDLVTTRLEYAAQKIFSLQRRIAELEEQTLPTTSELNFLRIRLQAIEAQYKAYVPGGGDEELRESVERWMGEWEALGGRTRSVREVG